MAAPEVDDFQSADIVAVLNPCLRTDDGERQLLGCHRLADMVGESLNTRHGACQKPSVDV